MPLSLPSRLREILEIAEDMEIDIPHIWLYLAELITPILQEEGIPMEELFRWGLYPCAGLLWGPGGGTCNNHVACAPQGDNKAPGAPWEGHHTAGRGAGLIVQGHGKCILLTQFPAYVLGLAQGRGRTLLHMERVAVGNAPCCTWELGQLAAGWGAVALRADLRFSCRARRLRASCGGMGD